MTCALVEPQYNEGLAEAVIPADLHVGRIDAIGVDFAPGPDHYPATLGAIADAIAGCPK